MRHMKLDSGKPVLLIRIVFRCLCILLLFLPQAKALDPVELGSEPSFYRDLINDVEFFIDPTTELTITDVQGLESFSSIQTPYIDFGLTQSRVWLRSKFTNSSKQSGVWRFDTRRQYNLETHVFIIRENGGIEEILYNTENSKFSERPLPAVLLTVDFNMEAGETVDLYVGYRSSNTTYLPIAVGKPSEVIVQHAREHSQNLVMNGILLTMMLIAFLMIPVIGWQLGISFSVYILVGLIYVFNADGYTFKYLWPQNPEYNDPANLSFMLLMPVFGLLFSKALFNSSETVPKIDKLLNITIATNILFAVLAIFFIKTDWLMVLGYSLVPVGTCMQLLAGAAAIKRKLLGGIPYFLGAIIVLSSMFYATLAHLKPGHYDLDHTLDYGHFALICECIAFICAVILRVMGIMRQRNKAIQSELTASRQSLELADKLQRSQKNYIQARKVSDLRRLQMENVSHDLRQPLLTLRQAIDNMPADSDQSHEKLSDAFNYLEKLSLQALSTQQVKKLQNEDHKERFSVSTIFDNVDVMFSTDAKSKGLNLRARPSNHTVNADPITLMRIVINLVSNAIKHSENGAILLASRTRQAKTSIEVWDTGVGMNESQITEVQQRHTKGKTSTGEGLGLDIVRELCEREGIIFTISSTPNRGTVCKLLVEP